MIIACLLVKVCDSKTKKYGLHKLRILSACPREDLGGVMGGRMVEWKKGEEENRKRVGKLGLELWMIL